jgi:hypothetical protein
MGRPFSERVSGEDWRREAEGWIRGQVEEHGHRLTGPIRQTRVRPWATQLAVPTEAGRLWFKAGCSAARFEPALHAELARLAPGSVDAPYAIDPDRAWMLTRERGGTLGDSHEPTTRDWQQVVAEVARMQRLLADHRDAVLATGVPDCRPATVVDRFDRLVELFAALPDDHPTQVTRDLRIRLELARPQLVDAAAQLAEASLPDTWQHGDLHPWNVFAVGGESLRVFDFGDSQWAHAIEVLSVPFGWITTKTDLSWPAILESYCAVWEIVPADLGTQWSAAGLTQPVNRAMTWWGCLAEASAAEWAEWGAAPLHHLTRVLDP